MTSALAFLRQFEGDADAMRQLRGVASRKMLDGGHGVLEKLARMMVSGELVITVPKALPPPAGHMQVATPVREMAPRMAAAARELEELVTFPESLHGSLQAASLQKASDEGVPFCEVCERMRKRGAA